VKQYYNNYLKYKSVTGLPAVGKVHLPKAGFPTELACPACLRYGLPTVGRFQIPVGVVQPTLFFGFE